jgi:DNA polymerase III subunit gamma/tau
MSYLVLARKYRPQTFSDIIGQEHITTAICNALVRDRVAHAMLFTGSRGVGKTSSARIIAKALNCTGRRVPTAEEIKNDPSLVSSLEPCGECSNCKEITRGVSLSVFEMDGASNNSVDDIRELIDTLYTAPPPGVTYKIYIIDEVHMLSTAAFNALLKSLEEPPKNTVFIFATTEPHKIPDTVLSRCQQHDFRRIPVSSLVTQLKKIAQNESFDIDDSVLSLIAKRAEGGMRDATTLLDRVSASSEGRITFESVSKVLGAFDVSHFASIIESVLEEDSSTALELISDAFSSSIDVRTYLSDFVYNFRVLSLFSQASRRGEKARARFIEVEEISEVELEHISRIATKFSAEILGVLFDHSRKIVDAAVKSEYPRYVMEAGVIKLAQLSTLVPVSDIVRQIRSLGGSSPSLQKSVNNASEELLSEESKKKNGESELGPLTPSDALPSNPAAFHFLWNDFISFLKTTRDLRLDAYMRRVAPKEFYVHSTQKRGVLTLLATSFEIEAFKDQETLELLKKRLRNFSTVDDWEVGFLLHDNPISSKLTSEQPFSGTALVPERQNVTTTSGSASPISVSTNKKSGTRHVPGSVAANSEQKRKSMVHKIKEEAKEDEFVKIILDVFEGSTIDKVTPLKRIIRP